MGILNCFIFIQGHQPVMPNTLNPRLEDLLGLEPWQMVALTGAGLGITIREARLAGCRRRRPSRAGLTTSLHQSEDH